MRGLDGGGGLGAAAVGDLGPDRAVGGVEVREGAGVADQPPPMYMPSKTRAMSASFSGIADRTPPRPPAGPGSGRRSGTCAASPRAPRGSMPRARPVPLARAERRRRRCCGRCPARPMRAPGASPRAPKPLGRRQRLPGRGDVRRGALGGARGQRRRVGGEAAGGSGGRRGRRLAQGGPGVASGLRVVSADEGARQGRAWRTARVWARGCARPGRRARSAEVAQVGGRAEGRRRGRAGGRAEDHLRRLRADGRGLDGEHPGVRAARRPVHRAGAAHMEL